nr:unnamed protein product [Callosobruchus chinensis]
MRLRCRCGSKENDADGSKKPHRAWTAPQRRRTSMCIF